MILVDSNLLIYSATDCPERPMAQTWLDGTINSGTRVGMPWASLLAFTRLVINHRLHKRPYRTHEAVEQIDWWLACPNVWIPEPTVHHMSYFAQTLKDISGDASLTNDAHLAALALEHGLTVYSSDTDFARFNGLKWVNPLKNG